VCVCVRVCVLALNVRTSEWAAHKYFMNSWGWVWCNFNTLCLDSSPCPHIFGGEGKIAGNFAQKCDDALIRRLVVAKQCNILVKTMQVSLYPFQRECGKLVLFTVQSVVITLL